MYKPLLESAKEEERFLAKIRKTDSCWEWIGSKMDKGYGNFTLSIFNSNHPKTKYAHRISYEYFHKENIGSFTIDHLCRNPVCVNPDHLEKVTLRENVLRGISPAAQQARRTHCIYGHPFSEENTYHRPDRKISRNCRICKQRIDTKWRKRKMSQAWNKARKPAKQEVSE